MAEGEGFEPPMASRSGEFQVLEASGTISYHRPTKGGKGLPSQADQRGLLSDLMSDTARLPQLAPNLNDLQKQVGVLKGFVR
jgi:hypothetical protein